MNQEGRGQAWAEPAPWRSPVWVGTAQPLAHHRAWSLSRGSSRKSRAGKNPFDAGGWRLSSQLGSKSLLEGGPAWHSPVSACWAGGYLL